MAKHYIDRDTVMRKEEFYKLSKSDKRALMQHWRLIHTTNHIKHELGLSTTAFYALLKRLDLPTDMQKWKDNQPSILGEDDVIAETVYVDEPKQEEQMFDIEVVGTTKQTDINKLIELARSNSLEIRMK